VNLTLTEERLALREVVRALLEKHSTSAAVRAAVDTPRGYDETLWTRMCEQVGVAALAIPEEYGGAGAGVWETCVVLGELGRTLTPVPMFGSAFLATQALLATGDEEALARLLPGIAAGTTLAALAWPGATGQWDPDAAGCTALPADTGWRLHGEAHYVLDGDLADVLIVAARCGDELALFEVEPDQFGVDRTHVPTMDITRRLAVVRLSEVRGRRLGAGCARPILRRLRDLGCVGLAAEQAGAAARALELTVEYTKTRVQFGRPIGGFQALKHRMADLHVLVETAESAARAAIAAADGGEELEMPAAVAKVHCSEALSQVAAEMIQLHGGIAITWEHDAHLYFKRAHADWHLFGQPGAHVDRVAGLLGF
jgi:alkylation response protein AidB-like acyl-CoA dehydrogenase